MQYASITDLALLGAAARAFADVDPEVMDAALLAASEEADGYFASRHTTPMVSVDSATKKAVCAIACWSVIGNRGFKLNAGADAVFRLNYEDAITWLLRVSRGEITPRVVEAAPAQVPFSGPRVISRPLRGFGRCR